MPPQTLFEKIWNDHVVIQEPGQPALLYIDLHVLRTPPAFVLSQDQTLHDSFGLTQLLTSYVDVHHDDIVFKDRLHECFHSHRTARSDSFDIVSRSL